MARNKWCWHARETRAGWKVSLMLGAFTFRSADRAIKSVKAVENLVSNVGGNIVFSHLKDTKYPVKK
jgi:hypothetical protein